MNFVRAGRWLGIAAALVLVTNAHATPVPLEKGSMNARPRVLASLNAGSTAVNPFQVVGNGVYPAISSKSYVNPSQWATIPFINGGITLTAPTVIGVFWPGAQPPDPTVHALFPDFVTDLFDGPYWNAVMPQYVGTAHGVFQSSVDIHTLLTVAPGNTVHSRYIAQELLAQQQAGVLPAMDPQFNTIYVVHFPPGVAIVDETYLYDDWRAPQLHVSMGTSCVQYCAYHDQYLNPSPLAAFTFVVMPDFSQNSTCASSCGSGTPFEVYTEVLAHELFETVTDPYGVGWLNTCTSGEEEIADVCQPFVFHVPRRTSTPGTPRCPNRWAMSAVFSNAAWNPSNAYGCVVADATTQECTLGVVPEPGLATTLELSAPSPNPSVGSTHVRYTLPFASFVRLSVTDVAGRQVAVLDQQVEGPGTHDASWNGRDASGNRAPAGLYFVRLQSAGQIVARRVVIER